MKFKLCNWLKKYIILITKYRTNSQNNFGNKLYKFLNSSVFGKITQNHRKQRDIQLNTNRRIRNILASSLNIKGSKYISDHL